MEMIEITKKEFLNNAESNGLRFLGSAWDKTKDQMVDVINANIANINFKDKDRVTVKGQRLVRHFTVDERDTTSSFDMDKRDKVYKYRNVYLIEQDNGEGNQNCIVMYC